MHALLSVPGSRARAIARLALFGAVVFTVAACGGSDDVGNAKISQIDTGMTKDSVFAILGDGPLVAVDAFEQPQIERGFRRQQYMVNGETFSVIWYRELPGSLNDAIVDTISTPILLQGDTVIAAGWKSFNKKSMELNLPNPSRDAERLDSISASQSRPQP
jgi:hypothetical protein